VCLGSLIVSRKVEFELCLGSENRYLETSLGMSRE
jgi:hypothetical protein